MPRSSSSTDTSVALRLFRVFLGVGGVALLAVGAQAGLSGSGAVDPGAGRMALAMSALVLFGLTFTSRLVARHAVGLIYAFFAIVSAWQVALAYVNAFSPTMAFGLILVFIGCSAGLTSPWLLGGYSVVFVGSVAVLASLVPEPLVPRQAFLVTLTALAALGTFAQYVRQQAMMRLERLREDALGAARAKSEFLATMSHEIRTPLNGVIGMTDVLGTTTLSPDQRDYVETIRSSGDALLAIINDVLDFSKIEAGRVDLETVPFDVRPFIEDALDVVAPSAASQGVELVAHVRRAVPHTLLGDEVRLRQIVLNLLGNAVKFTERGSVVLEVAPAPGGVDLIVRDTGVGIPAERLRSLFESFTQGDASTTRRYGGTGLGLAITKRLAELMGGTVEAESEPGVGSTFRVRLPLDAGPDGPAAPHATSPLSILVVDDHPDARAALADALTELGFVPSAHASAEDALAWLDGGGTAALLLVDHDLGLGATPPAELVRRLRERPGAPLPVVALMPAGARLASPGLFDAVVHKPVRRARLLDMVAGLTETEAPASAPDPLHRSPAFGPPLRVLLAEDHPVNRRVAVGLLGHLHQPTDQAVNGAEAVAAVAHAAAEGAPYDLVLMDVQMPEMDGLEATRRIRASVPPGSQPAIVALTANALAGDAERCYAVGMDAYLTKPVRLKDLEALLASVRDGTLAPSAAMAPPARPHPDGAAHPATPQGPPHASAPPAVPTTPATVLACLRTLSAGDDALVDEILDAYLRSDLVLIEELEAADPTTVAKAAHKLRSAAGTLGADGLAHQATEVERTALDGDLTPVPAFADGLRAFRQTVAQARTLLARPARPVGR